MAPTFVVIDCSTCCTRGGVSDDWEQWNSLEGLQVEDASVHGHPYKWVNSGTANEWFLLLWFLLLLLLLLLFSVGLGACREYLATFKKTVAMHEVFLQRLASHPTLRNDHHYQVFLEFDGDVSQWK